MDSRTYEVEFPDGRTAEVSANAITEHMFTQCNPTGNQYLLLDSINDHKIEDSAVKDSDQYVEDNGQLHHKKNYDRSQGVCLLEKQHHNVGMNG